MLSLEVNKKHIQKRKREKLPVDIPSNIPEVKKEEPVVLELPKHMKEEMEAEAHPFTEERLTVTPLQPPNNPKPNSALTRDSKCVRICEEPPTTISNPPRSVSPWSFRLLSLLFHCVNFSFFVFLFLGFVWALH